MIFLSKCKLTSYKANSHAIFDGCFVETVGRVGGGWRRQRGRQGGRVWRRHVRFSVALIGRLQTVTRRSHHWNQDKNRD